MTHTAPTAAAAGRVRRPLGLSLAVWGTAALFGVLPLLEVYFLKRLNATADEAFVMGGVDISTWTWLEGLFGGVMLIVCALAWLGRPGWIRFVLVGLLLLMTAVNAYRIYDAWTTTVDPIFGGQMQAGLRGLLRCQLPALFVLPPYVVWYINRAPARAFYRHVPLAAADASRKAD
jgi:hypothetical protein